MAECRTARQNHLLYVRMSSVRPSTTSKQTIPPLWCKGTGPNPGCNTSHLRSIALRTITAYARAAHTRQAEIRHCVTRTHALPITLQAQLSPNTSYIYSSVLGSVPFHQSISSQQQYPRTPDPTPGIESISFQPQYPGTWHPGTSAPWHPGTHAPWYYPGIPQS